MEPHTIDNIESPSKGVNETCWLTVVNAACSSIYVMIALLKLASDKCVSININCGVSVLVHFKGL